MLVDAQDEKNSPFVLAQTLIAIGRIVSDLETDKSNAQYELERENEKGKEAFNTISKLRQENTLLDKRYHEASDIARFETAKALAARTLLINLIEDKKLKGKDLKAAKEVLDLKKLPTVDLTNGIKEVNCKHDFNKTR